MARTQRNKATAKHLGLLKARLAKLKAELMTAKTGGGGGGEGVLVNEVAFVCLFFFFFSLCCCYSVVGSVSFS